MSRTILAPTLRFVRRISYTHHDYTQKINYLIEYDTFEAATYYVWHGITYANALIFHRRTSDGALFINEPVIMKSEEEVWKNDDNIWKHVYFMDSMEALYDFKVRFDTPLPSDEIGCRAAKERPAFTKDVIRTLLAKPLPAATV